MESQTGSTKEYSCPTCENAFEFPGHVEDREMVCATCLSQDVEPLHVGLVDTELPDIPPEDTELSHADLMEATTRPTTPYINSPNRGSGLSVAGVVIHYTAGSYSSAISWFQNPAAQVSAHFVVAKDGRRTQMVPLPDPDDGGPRDGRYQAWHCRGGNARYVGIEHEGNGRPDEWTDAMLQSSAEIAAYLCSLYRIPVVGPPGPSGHREWFTGFGGHYNVPGNNHSDPGPNFPWERYLDLVGKILNEGIEDMASVPQWQWDRLLDRVLRMSAGVPGQNFNGEQFDLEQGKFDGIIQRLDQIEAQLQKLPKAP